MTETAIPFAAVGRLPLPADNVAIATKRLPAGTVLEIEGNAYTLDFTVPEGHRFAVKTIAPGEGLLSWGLPFGIASQPITPGQYVCNAGMIEALKGRTLDFRVPQQPNFYDQIAPYELNEATFQPGKQVAPYSDERTFLGYRRSPARGVGTRNMIVILGVTSSTAGFAKALAAQLQPAVANLANLDGITPIAHTEGSGYAQLNNRQYLLRTLAGLMVHPNVAAVLTVDIKGRDIKGRDIKGRDIKGRDISAGLGSEDLTNHELQQFMQDQGYPLGDVLHQFVTLSGDWQADLAQCSAIVGDWLPTVTAMQRTPQSLANLAIALQCGGSDAFSGVSGNPLASAVAKEIIRYGGQANLAETDELIGAEAYMLQNVRDLATARAFLHFIAEFQERLSWHGQSAEGNPSGGNKLRGLYNIALKSIGAAMKRHPDLRLDQVIDYGERMIEPGFHFMNSPGNDLESIAGQVASGANLIIFITGNGSITNFPFVPTIKVMTTSNRYALLSNEMDVNAGAYLDGTPMETLTQETLDLLVEIASGKASRGELAGHSQISIWRNWQQQDRSKLPQILARPKPSGMPIPLVMDPARFSAKQLNFPPIQPKTHGSIGLILPTSLCSGQIARLAATRLNAMEWGEDAPLSHFATVVHTEGCGVAFASTREVYAETIVGHALHPQVGDCLFLEHGCEKAHNNYLQSLIHERGLSMQDFGWASVQLDGGIDKVIARISDYFRRPKVNSTALHANTQTRRNLAVAFLMDAEIDAPVALLTSLAEIIQQLVSIGGTAVLPNDSNLLGAPALLAALGFSEEPKPSLAYGQVTTHPGFHLMESPTAHWTETITGLAATGVDAIIAFTDKPRPGHPFVPVLLVGDAQAKHCVDLALANDPTNWTEQIFAALDRLVSGQQQPKTFLQNNIDFQMTRGWLGIST